jgi:hypothetical protein
LEIREFSLKSRREFAEFISGQANRLGALGSGILRFLVIEKVFVRHTDDMTRKPLSPRNDVRQPIACSSDWKGIGFCSFGDVRRQKAPGQDFHAAAENRFEFIFDFGQVVQRRTRGRINQDIEIAMIVVLATSRRPKHPWIRHTKTREYLAYLVGMRGQRDRGSHDEHRIVKAISGAWSS